MLFEDTPDGKKLHIHMDFKRGSRLASDKDGSIAAYDTEEWEWRHLNFFGYNDVSVLENAQFFTIFDAIWR